MDLKLINFKLYHKYYLTLCHRYDSSTGQFTVPTGEAGLYYFCVHGAAKPGEAAGFCVRQNGASLCRPIGDDNSGDGNDFSIGTCAATVVLEECMFL